MRGNEKEGGKVTIDTDDLGKQDFVLLIPLEIAVVEHSGDALHYDLQEMLRWFATIGFYPTGWMARIGGGVVSHYPLKLRRMLNWEDAAQATERFIKHKGIL